MEERREKREVKIREGEENIRKEVSKWKHDIIQLNESKKKSNKRNDDVRRKVTGGEENK